MLTMIGCWSTPSSKINAIDVSFLIMKTYYEPSEDDETSLVHPLWYCEMLLRYMSRVELEACTTEGPRDGLSKGNVDSSFSCVWVTTTLELYLRLHFLPFFIGTNGTSGGTWWHLPCLEHHRHLIQFQLLLSPPSSSQHEILWNT